MRPSTVRTLLLVSPLSLIAFAPSDAEAGWPCHHRVLHDYHAYSCGACTLSPQTPVCPTAACRTSIAYSADTVCPTTLAYPVAIGVVPMSPAMATNVTTNQVVYATSYATCELFVPRTAEIRINGQLTRQQGEYRLYVLQFPRPEMPYRFSIAVKDGDKGRYRYVKVRAGKVLSLRWGADDFPFVGTAPPEEEEAASPTTGQETTQDEQVATPPSPAPAEGTPPAADPFSTAPARQAARSGMDDPFAGATAPPAQPAEVPKPAATAKPVTSTTPAGAPSPSPATTPAASGSDQPGTGNKADDKT